MNKTLKENIKQYADDLSDEIEQLKHRNDDYAEIKTESLSGVIDYLETLLDAEQWREFRDNQKKEEIDEYKEKYYKLKNKDNERHYIDHRAEEIFQQYDVFKSIQKMLAEYYNLGRSSVYGVILYMLESNNFNKETIREFIIKELKHDKQVKCDTYSVLSEFKMKFDKE